MKTNPINSAPFLLGFTAVVLVALFMSGCDTDARAPAVPDQAAALSLDPGRVVS